MLLHACTIVADHGMCRLRHGFEHIRDELRTALPVAAGKRLHERRIVRMIFRRMCVIAAVCPRR